MGENATKSANMLTARANYYLLRETYKPVSEINNLKEFYKTIHLADEKARNLIDDGQSHALPKDNPHTKKFSKDTGININALLGIDFLSIPIKIEKKEWEDFFEHSSGADENIKKHIHELLNELLNQYKYYDVYGRVNKFDNNITDLFKWYYYLKKGKRVEVSKQADSRLDDFHRVLGMTEYGIWKNCPDTTLDECIESMKLHLKAAEAVKVYRKL